MRKMVGYSIIVDNETVVMKKFLKIIVAAGTVHIVCEVGDSCVWPPKTLMMTETALQMMNLKK